MANNIIISRIQNRRGRRENLPQPLLPAEVALTADSGEVWIGSDPGLATPTINVYEDKLEATAQGIVDNNIAESKFDENFSASNFNTLISELTGTPTPAVVLTDKDILWDNTFHGEILDISTITAPGTGYTTGDAITAISATGSGFVGTVTATAGAIDGVVITSGGSNYRQSNTTFTIAAGTGGEINVVLSDIHGTSVHIAADPNIDALNTVANVTTAVANTSAPVSNRLISTAAFGGTFATNSLIVNNHTEAANVTVLINRVNSTTANEITGIVFTNLNIKLNQGSAGGPVDVIFMRERAAAETSITAQGQLWVRDDAPNVLMFTDDDGNDFEISTGGAGVTLDTDQTITGFKTFDNNLWIDNGNNLRVISPDGTNFVDMFVTNAGRFQFDTTGITDSIAFNRNIKILGGNSFTINNSANNASMTLQYSGTTSVVVNGSGAFTNLIFQTGKFLDMNDNIVESPQIKDYAITHATQAQIGSTVTYNYTTAQSRVTTLSADITNVVVQIPPGSGNYGELTIKFIQDSTPRTITWPAKFHFPNGVPPVMTTASGAVDIVHMWTTDGGTTWDCTFVQDSK